MSVKCIPLTPHFYIVKRGFTGVYIFLIFALKHRLRVPVRTAWCLHSFILKSHERQYAIKCRFVILRPVVRN